MGMANLQKMAQQMQQEMLRIQTELESTLVDGSAGGGVVRATVTGKQELVSVTIDPSAVDPDDVEMLQDLVLAAVNEALRSSRELAEAEDVGRHRRASPARDVGDASSVVSPVIEPVARLIESFARLPGIGPKTAQRLTFHLLRAQESEARTLAAALIDVRDKVVFCDRCFNISDQPLCPICRDPGRDTTRLCVVEEPLDVLALERTGEFKGLYHVLNGAISPIDGVGPDQLRIRELLERADTAARDGEPFVEVIMATNPTLEGEATAMYLAERLEPVVGIGHPDRPRPAGRWRPRIRRRGDAHPGAPGPSGGLSRPMSNLVNEILLRLAKAGIAALLGVVLYVVLVGPLGATGSVELALLCWLSAAAFVLLVETGLI